ncbi:MAG: nucleotidyltransferase domain-containing protein [Eubacterium sp.]
MINDEILAIKDQLVTTLNPTQIYLFGSYARNTNNANSDYDFYLCTSFFI